MASRLPAARAGDSEQPVMWLLRVGTRSPMHHDGVPGRQPSGVRGVRDPVSGTQPGRIP